MLEDITIFTSYSNWTFFSGEKKKSSFWWFILPALKMSMLISESGHPLILLSLEFPLGNGRLQPVSGVREREREREREDMATYSFHTPITDTLLGIRCLVLCQAISFRSV